MLTARGTETTSSGRARRRRLRRQAVLRRRGDRRDARRPAPRPAGRARGPRRPVTIAASRRPAVRPRRARTRSPSRARSRPARRPRPHAGPVVSREELMYRAWTRPVRLHEDARRPRPLAAAELGESAVTPSFLHTVRGIGFPLPRPSSRVTLRTRPLLALAYVPPWPSSRSRCPLCSACATASTPRSAPGASQAELCRDRLRPAPSAPRCAGSSDDRAHRAAA